MPYLAKSEIEEKKAADEIQRLQALLKGRDPEMESLLVEKDKQLHVVVSEYEEKMSSANEQIRQRETELLAQVSLICQSYDLYLPCVV